MRPRYRVWDKEEKKMIYDAEHTYDNYPVNISSFGAILDLPDLYAVMQYTGIKDIHSNRVFEGDIVRFSTSSGEDYIGEVKYFEDSASFFIRAERHYLEYLDDVYALKVLGNIYQNKELLND